MALRAPLARLSPRWRKERIQTKKSPLRKHFWLCLCWVPLRFGSGINSVVSLYTKNQLKQQSEHALKHNNIHTCTYTIHSKFQEQTFSRGAIRNTKSVRGFSFTYSLSLSLPIFSLLFVVVLYVVANANRLGSMALLDSSVAVSLMSLCVAVRPWC